MSPSLPSVARNALDGSQEDVASPTLLKPPGLKVKVPRVRGAGPRQGPGRARRWEEVEPVGRFPLPRLSSLHRGTSGFA